MRPDHLLGPGVLSTLLTLAITEAFNFNMQPEDKNIYVKNRQVKNSSIALFLELPSEFLPVCHDAVLQSLSTSAHSHFSISRSFVSHFCFLSVISRSQDLHKMAKTFLYLIRDKTNLVLLFKELFLSLSHLFFFDDFFHMLFTLTLTHVTLVFHHFPTLK